MKLSEVSALLDLVPELACRIGVSKDSDFSVLKEQVSDHNVLAEMSGLKWESGGVLVTVSAYLRKIEEVWTVVKVPGIQNRRHQAQEPMGDFFDELFFEALRNRMLDAVLKIRKREMRFEIWLFHVKLPKEQ